MIRVVLPYHLRSLAQVGAEVQVEVTGPVTQRSVLDALEARYPSLRGTIRDHVTQLRRLIGKTGSRCASKRRTPARCRSKTSTAISRSSNASARRANPRTKSDWSMRWTTLAGPPRSRFAVTWDSVDGGLFARLQPPVGV